MTQMFTGRFWNRSGKPGWAHLDGKSALLRHDHDREGRYLAQFDDLELLESHGWTSLPEDHFDRT